MLQKKGQNKYQPGTNRSGVFPSLNLTPPSKERTILTGQMKCNHSPMMRKKSIRYAVCLNA